MPAIALLPPEQWEALKLANIRGVSDEDLAEKFEVTREAIRSKRFRDPAWSAAMSDAREKPKSEESQRNVNETARVVSTVISENLASIHNGTAVTLAKASAKVLGEFAQTAPVPRDWSEAATTYKVLRLATGADSEGAKITLNIGLSETEAGQVVEAEGWVVGDGQESSTDTESVEI